MSSVKHETLVSVKWSLLERFATQVMQFGLGLVLARLLLPSDFGAVGMLAIFLALSQTFVDSGFGQALIRKLDRTEQDFSTVFCFNLVVAVLLYGVFAYWYYFSGSTAVYVFALFFYYVEIISAGLAVFNVFPIPPLDGSKVLFSCLSDKAYLWLMRYERYGMALLMLMLLTGVLDTPLEFLRDGLLNGLEAIGTWPVQLLLALR